MSAQNFNQERLMNILLAPQIQKKQLMLPRKMSK